MPASDTGGTVLRRKPDQLARNLDVFSASHLLTEPPELLDTVGDAERRRLYPEEARRGGMEAEVRVRLTIDDDGSVVDVKVSESPGYGFDDATRKLVRLYRFKPAHVNGTSVATELPFTIHFELHF